LKRIPLSLGLQHVLGCGRNCDRGTNGFRPIALGDDQKIPLGLDFGFYEHLTRQAELEPEARVGAVEI
jgi:hypothetical protein